MMNILFFIKNMKEYEAVKKIIAAKSLKDFVILCLDNNPPYLTDRYSNLEGVRRWAEFGVQDLTLNRYWLQRYKEIEKIVKKTTEKAYYYDKIANTPYFIFGIVWKLGDAYYKYIDTLNTFFADQKPQAVFFSRGESFIDRLLFSFVRLNEAKYSNLRKAI